MSQNRQRPRAHLGVVIGFVGAVSTSAWAQVAPPLLSPPAVVGGYVSVAETLELVSLQLRIEGLLGTDQAWLQRAWDSAVARPDRPAVLASLAQTADRLFAFVETRLAADTRLSAMDRARARSRLADARALYAYAQGADGNRTPALERALDALALANPQAPRVDLRSVPSDVARWLAGALDRSVAGSPASRATGAPGSVAGAPAPGLPVAPPAVPVRAPVAVAPPPSPQPQGIPPTRPPDYVALPQPGSQAGGLIGCFTDAENRDLTGYSFSDGSMSIGVCRATCASKGFAFAGVQFSTWCFCGDSYGKHGPSNACTMPCAGAGSETCGGSYANSVYSTRDAAGVPSPPASSMPPLDLGTWWSEEESGLRGAWVRRPGTTTFDAFWPGNFVKATIEVVAFGPQVRLRRSQGSDGYECEYTGTRNGSEITGTFGCNRAPGPMPWRAWIQGASAAPPAPAVPPVAGGTVPSLLGTWAIACCNDALTGSMTISQQQGASFSGIMEGGLQSQSVVGRIQGDVVEFDRRTDEGPQRWSGRLAGSGSSLRIVGGVWSGAYEGRFTPGQRNWHAEKQR